MEHSFGIRECPRVQIQSSPQLYHHHKFKPRNLDMRRWSGTINQWSIDLRVISYEDDANLSSLLSRRLDPVMESLAHFIFSDTLITNTNNYVWITSGDDIHGLNQRIRYNDSFASNFLVTNNIDIISVFTYVSFGSRGRRQPPTRYEPF